MVTCTKLYKNPRISLPSLIGCPTVLYRDLYIRHHRIVKIPNHYWWSNQISLSLLSVARMAHAFDPFAKMENSSLVAFKSPFEKFPFRNTRNIGWWVSSLVVGTNLIICGLGSLYRADTLFIVSKAGPTGLEFKEHPAVRNKIIPHRAITKNCLFLKIVHLHDD